jgi:hypothetical protein
MERNVRFEDRENVTPRSYAAHLATYIASPTKIEALTRIEFGRAPPLHTIAEMRHRVEQERRRYGRQPRSLAKRETRNEADDYVLPSLVKPEPPIEPIELRPPSPNPFVGLYSTGARVVASVASDFDLTPEDITGTRRFKKLIEARAVVAKVLRRWGRRSYPEIARVMHRDHSTVIHAVQHFDIYCRRNDLVGQSYLRHLALIEEAERETARRLQEAEAA